jgi:hypothetical protein
MQGSPMQGSSPVLGTQGGMIGNDIVGRTFTGCFLYMQDELQQSSQQSQQQGTEDEEAIEAVCVRINSKQQTNGVIGEQQQQAQQSQTPQSSPQTSPQSSPTKSSDIKSSDTKP